eukprot:972416-Amphidinium_carterae.2
MLDLAASRSKLCWALFRVCISKIRDTGSAPTAAPSSKDSRFAERSIANHSCRLVIRAGCRTGICEPAPQD